MKETNKLHDHLPHSLALTPLKIPNHYHSSQSLFSNLLFHPSFLLKPFLFLQWRRRSLTLPASPCFARTTTTPFQLHRWTLSLLLGTSWEGVRGRGALPSLEFRAPRRKLLMTGSWRRKSTRWRNVGFWKLVSFAVVPRRSVEFRLTLRDRFSIIYRFIVLFFSFLHISRVYLSILLKISE